MLNALATAARIRDEYRGYLRSTFALRDPELSRDLDRALDGDHPLTRGPFLQATPPYVLGRTIRGLIDDGVLSGRLADVGEVLPPDRALYSHQEEAVVKARAGRNLMIATGTGSGKTESFMIPIVDHLLREAEAGTLAEAGVRALLLYPMNALANDQLKRLRLLLSGLPEITFGRYVGETEGRRGAALATYRSRTLGEDPLRNELISREEMQERPPHILLTNFAMLEYLLLRPDDSPLFDGPTGMSWRFLVLDEIHVYDGAKGTEIAMLLRRLRDRVARSEPGRLQCFGTSATLGRGQEDYPALAEFGQALFGELFEWDAADPARQDVVGARRRPLVMSETAHRLSDDALRSLHREFRSGGSAADLCTLLGREGITVESGEKGPSAAVLHDALRADERVVTLQRLLENGSAETADLASRLFPDSDDGEARLVELIDLCVAAKAHQEDAPLVPARYHFFLRSLDGAFACLHPDHPQDSARLLLTRHESCPACEAQGIGSTMVEIGACRLCGAEYALGKLDGKRLAQAGPMGATAQFLLGPSVELDQDDEDDEHVWGPATTSTATTLCPSCAGLETACACASPPEKRAVMPVRVGGEDAVRRCPGCGRRSTGDIIRRLVTGGDAPVAVIATDLYQAIPPATEGSARNQPGQGRKLLAFSDSRQDAAFFASYLDRTYERALVRRLIVDAIECEPGPEVWAPDLEAPLKERAIEEKIIDPDASEAQQLATIRTWIMREILALDARLSIDGTGVAEIAAVTPRSATAHPGLLDIGLADQEALDLVTLLLETLRRGGAVTPPERVDIRSDDFSPRNKAIYVRQTSPAHNVLSWLPGRGSNSRLDLLQRVLARLGSDRDPAKVLSEVWRMVTSQPWDKVLAPESHRQEGTVYRLSYARLGFRHTSDDGGPLVCDRCGRVAWRSVRGVCPQYRCAGALRPARPHDLVRSRHYVHRYRSLEPIPMRVEEHTAQWTSPAAGEIQERFVRGDLNALSCSTTFELGVDVGDVQTVLLHNVPPSPANYVQRAGRAGRRSDSAALVVTFAQRRNHDANYFANPTQMIEGVIAPPSIVLDNVPIARRHGHSIAFAAFERSNGSHGTVGDFFLEDGQPAPSTRFIEWLRERPVEVGGALLRILPDTLHEPLGISDWRWVEELATESQAEPTHGWLARAEAEVRGDLSRIEEEMTRLSKERKFTQAGHFQRLDKTIRGRQLISFLGSRNILPKYGFPVDVVELDVSGSGDADAGRIELTRDLRVAISEFAPGSQIVAAKKLWEPHGLRTRADRDLPVYGWAICKQCGMFRTQIGIDAGDCDCGGSENEEEGSYLIPIWGFTGGQSTSSPGESRPARVNWGEVFFASYGGPAPELQPALDGRIACRVSRQGRIVVINRGSHRRGFRVCTWCGRCEVTDFGRRSKPGAHTDIRRPGRECRGTFRTHHLGHELLSDLLEMHLGNPMSDDQARAVLAALLESVPAVGVSRDDVDGTIALGTPGSRAIVIFDAVPGGAGHARRLHGRLGELFAAALERVANCICGEETSCYGCLRSFSNQMYHEQLSRGAAREVLESVVSATRAAHP